MSILTSMTWYQLTVMVIYLLVLHELGHMVMYYLFTRKAVMMRIRWFGMDVPFENDITLKQKIWVLSSGILFTVPLGVFGWEFIALAFASGIVDLIVIGACVMAGRKYGFNRIVQELLDLEKVKV